MIQALKQKLYNEETISKSEAMQLVTAPLDELTHTANEIREYFCGSSFDLCSIINAKSGKCSENCRYCAQSSHYSAKCDVYPLISEDTASEHAIQNEKAGILRFSLVTSGRSLNDDEIDKVCTIAKRISKDSDISICGSFGLLNEEQYKKLYASGIKRIHNNIEASRHFFPYVCTTHSFDDKLAAIKAAINAGMSVCSGGIMGLGESFEDRIDMALELNRLGILSIPINMLNPIKGTPMQNNKILSNEEMQRTIAIFRFINPKASIRLAGGRGLMEDKGEACFKSGANAAITMNMLTTNGITAADDLALIKRLGFTPKLQND